MKKGIIFAVLVAMLGFAIYDFVASSKEQANEENQTSQNTNPITEDTSAANLDNPTVGLEAGNLAPDFTLETLDGKTVRLSDYRGKTILLNFWATWCPPCRSEMPDMQKFYEDEDVEILAVNLTQQEASMEDVKSFVEEYGLTFPVLLDQNLQVATDYGIQVIPSSFMIDKNGIIQYTALGALNYETMVSELKKLP
jgi:peroxiredoxin